MATAPQVLDLSVVSRELLPRRINFVRCRKPDVVERPAKVILLRRANDLADVPTSTAPEAAAPPSDGDPLLCQPEMNLCREAPPLTWPSIRGPCAGLLNIGNTCFMNSVLQAFAYLPPLAALFLKVTPNATDPTFNAVSVIADVIQQLHASKQAVAPKALFMQLNAFLSRRDFRRGEQADAHEFAMKVIEMCQNNFVKRLSGGRKLSPLAESTTPLMRVIGGYLRSEVKWKKMDEVDALRKIKSPLASQAAAETAGSPYFASRSYEASTMLHLPVVGATMHDCLRRFFTADVISGQCYKTPRGVGVDVTRGQQLHLLPRVLAIHMKRFTNSLLKINRHIQFEPEIDVKPYCSEECIAQGQQTQYRLYSVVVHLGHSLSCGHYIAYVRAPNDLWYCADDSRVHPVNISEVKKALAFMLFYVQVPSNKKPPAPAPVVQQQATPDLGTEVDPQTAASSSAAKTPAGAPPRPLSSAPVAEDEAEEEEEEEEDEVRRHDKDEKDSSDENEQLRGPPVRVHRTETSTSAPAASSSPAPFVNKRLVVHNPKPNGDVDAVAELKQETEELPSTLKKRAFMGSFATYQRDAQWDAAFDKPKERKVRQNREPNPYDGRNQFQEIANVAQVKAARGETWMEGHPSREARRGGRGSGGRGGRGGGGRHDFEPSRDRSRGRGFASTPRSPSGHGDSGGDRVNKRHRFE